jgi:putative transposase
MAIFGDDEDRRRYLAFMREETERFGVEILSWCLMTNHVHFIAVPSTEDGLAKAIGHAHKAYTRMRNFREGVRGYLFQGRFGSCVLDEPHLLAAARYIERNPVKAGMVRVPWTYRWSSAQYHVGNRQTDGLVTDRHLRGLVQDWREFLLEEDLKAEEVIRQATRTGRPAGSGSFVKRVEKLTGRDLTKGKAGRPPKRQDQK